MTLEEGDLPVSWFAVGRRYQPGESRSVSLPGFENWVAVFSCWKIFRHLIFQGKPQYTQITKMDMYLHTEIKHNVHMQC